MQLRLHFVNYSVDTEVDADSFYKAITEIYKSSFNGMIIIDESCYNLKTVIKIEELDNEDKSEKFSQKTKKKASKKITSNDLS